MPVLTNTRLNYPSFVPRFTNTRFPTLKLSSLLNILTGDKVEMNHDQLDDFINQNVIHDNSLWCCIICNNMSAKSRLDVTRHVEAKHVTMPPIMCSLCNKSAKTRDSLRKHMAKIHPGGLC